ncbi:NADPh quinone reductase [Podila epigama]|nr:NADPh quinone reductase [Podila epigama]
MATYAPNLPETMKAIQWSNIGKPADILSFNHNLPLPTVTGTQILIQVHAAALNPVDWKLMKGGIPRLLMPSIKTPGLDVSGVVVALGPNVGQKSGLQRFSIGDRVMAMLDFSQSGAMQEFTLVQESILVHMPGSWDFNTAAALPLVATTIYEALVDRGGIKAGDKVLVNGASGGTGSTAVQLATALGASVVGVCSTANVDLVRKLGATDVVDYTTSSVLQQHPSKDFDIILDTVGTPELYAYSGQLLKSSGAFIQIAGSDSAMDSPLHLIHEGLRILYKKTYSLLTWGPAYHLFTCFPNGQRLAAAAHILVKANAKPIVEAVYTFSLDSVLEAYERSRSGRARGKLVISIKE